jgi:hypothetical protein
MVIVVNTIVSSTPMAETVRGPVSLARENGVSTPPPSDAPASALASAALSLAPSASAALAFLDFAEGQADLRLRVVAAIFKFLYSIFCVRKQEEAQ